MQTTLSGPATMTPAEFGRRYGIGEAKVLSWLARGVLTGINVGDGERKPRWRIRQSDIELFERRRANVPPAPTQRRPTKEERVEGFVGFFPEE